jgi:hypothetical protein
MRLIQHYDESEKFLANYQATKNKIFSKGPERTEGTLQPSKELTLESPIRRILKKGAETTA